MRIVWVTPLVPYPPRSGGAIRIYQLGRLLARRHAVRLLALGDERTRPSDLAALRERGLSVEVFATPRFPRRWTADWWKARWQALGDPGIFYFTPTLDARLRQLCEAGDADVVVLETLKMWRYGNGVSAAPVVLSRQNYEPRLSGRLAAIVRTPREKFGWTLATRLGTRCERRINARFRAITAVSALEAEIFHRMSPRADVVVVPNGVDLDRFTPVPGPEDRRTVVVTGSMGYLPNRDSALYFHREIWPAVTRRCPDARLMIVGSDVVEFVPELVGREGVELHDPEDAIASALAPATVVAVPLRAGAGTRIKVLELLAMGKPVVSTSIGCEGLDVTDGRDVLIADGAEKFARLVVRLLRDPDLRRQLGANGRRLVESRYGWDRGADTLAQFLASIVERDPRAVSA